jgi:enediyne biosynthesis protein E4
VRPLRHSAFVIIGGLFLSILTCASAIAQTHTTPHAPTPATQSIEAPQLVDITASTRIQFEHLSSSDQKYIVESMSGGVALIDYDSDGYPDIYFTNAPSVAMALANKKARSALYHNNHDGTFTDVTDHAGVGYPCWAMGAAVGDFNNDGRPDLIVSCFGGVVLYRNNGDGTFTDVTKAAGLDINKGWATGAVFGDYDADGNADLFVPHYVDFNMNDLPQFGSQITCQYHHVPVQCGPRGLKGSPDSLYRNNGDGTFTDVSKSSGVDDPNNFFGLGAVWSDFANDGKLDLFVANDGEPNYLYRNDGSGHFKDIALDSGVAVSDEGVEQANMGVAVGDYLNDGKMSIAISHFSEEYAVLYRNDGNLSFTDVSHQAGIAHPSVPYVGWGDAFVDLNNSGWQDFVLVNGHVYPQVDDAKAGIAYKEPKLVYINQRNGTFREMSAATGKAVLIPQVSRGLAVGDLFHSGVLDLVVENLVGGPMILEPKSNPSNHWVSFSLEGTPNNRLALNARIRVTTGTLQQLQEIRSGGSYLSQSDLHLHFGLGLARTIDKVEVMWPNGSTQTFTNLQPDHFYSLKQNGNLVPSTPPRAVHHTP